MAEGQGPIGKSGEAVGTIIIGASGLVDRLYQAVSHNQDHLYSALGGGVVGYGIGLGLENLPRIPTEVYQLYGMDIHLDQVTAALLGLYAVGRSLKRRPYGAE